MKIRRSNQQNKEFQESYLREMSINHIENVTMDTEEDEIQEERKVDHLNDIKETNGEDGSTNKSVNQIFGKKIKDLNNLDIESCILFKVNVRLRESIPDAYAPKMISIGPYHKKNPQLHPMENYKLLYLQRFLQRKEGLDVESCFRQLESVKDKALKCYRDIEDIYRDNTYQFLEMLLLDGCFVIEFIQENVEKKDNRIINVVCIRNQVCRDLILLENQLPFFVLTKIHDMTKDDHDLPLPKLVKATFLGYLPRVKFETFFKSEGNVENIKHLLQVVHMLCHPSETKNDKEHVVRCLGRLKDMTSHNILPIATELFEAGVSFKKVENISLFDIKFEKRTMKIPSFEVDDITETFLRNLIAYEQHSSYVNPKYVSDYITIMDYLIDLDKDVSLFRKNGIIRNTIGEDKEVANLFNKIGKGVTIESTFYYEEVCNKAFQHSKNPWNRIMANLRYNYFSSIWKGTATLGAIIVVIFTAIQTVRAFK